MNKLAMVKIAEVSGVLARLYDEGLLKVASTEMLDKLAEVVAEGLGDEYNMEDVLNETADVVETLDAIDNMSEEEKAELAAAVSEEAETPADEAVAEAVAEEAAAEAVEEASPVEEAKEASELLAQYGKLAMAKEAGEISDAYFQKEAVSIQAMLQALKAGGGKAIGAAKSGLGAAQSGLGKAKSGLTGEKLRNLRKGVYMGDGVERAAMAEALKKGTTADKILRNQGLKELALSYGGLGAAGLGAYGAKKALD